MLLLHVAVCLAANRDRFSPPDDRRAAGKALASVASEVLRTSRAKDVLLMYRDSSSAAAAAAPHLRRATRNDVLGEISAATTRLLPTLCAEDLRSPRIGIASRAMSRDLTAYVHVSEDAPDRVESERVAEDVRLLVHARVRPNVLVLMALRRPPSRDPAVLFRALWSRKILDAIVAVSHDGSTLVHRYDPFADVVETSRRRGVARFDDDFPNMRGHRLTYVFLRRPPYSDIARCEPTSGRLWKLRGVDRMVIETLADRMNFTGAPRILTRAKYLERLANGSKFGGIMDDVISGRYDALLNTLPMLEYEYVEFTDSVVVEDWCFAVPRLLAGHRGYVDGDVILSLLACLAIVAVFWAYARLAGLRADRWHPVRIVGLMLATSLPAAPARLHERIVYLSVFAACARFSSTLFAELTSGSLGGGDRYVRFDHPRDLIRAGLTLMVQPSVYEIVARDDVLGRHAARWRESGRLAKTSEMSKCLRDLLTYRNASCFMEVSWAGLVAVNNMRDGEPMLRTTGLCYLSPPNGYVFPRASPYVRRVSELLLLLAQSGIRDKWQSDYLRSETKEWTAAEETEEADDQAELMFVSVLDPIIYVLITGYSISALVLVGELARKYLVDAEPSDRLVRCVRRVARPRGTNHERK